MKLAKETNVLIALFLLVTVSGATVNFPFVSWNFLTEKSHDIAVVRCNRTPQLYTPEKDGTLSVEWGGLRNADMTVVQSLKGVGTNQLVTLRSHYYPRQGEFYLIFGSLDKDVFHANEKYRVVPLGLDFQTNILGGKSLDEQIRIMLDVRLGNLRRQIVDDQEEMNRLKQAVKKIIFPVVLGKPAKILIPSSSTHCARHSRETSREEAAARPGRSRSFSNTPRRAVFPVF